MVYSKHRILILVFVLGIVSRLQAQEILHWLGNDHYYMAFSLLTDWNRATEFSNDVYYLPGYLATVNSEEELQFLINNVPSANFPYLLGGRKNAQSDSWEWGTGEAWSFEQWCPGEPNNSSDAVIALNACGLMDVNTTANYPFIIEWDADPTKPIHKVDTSNPDSVAAFGSMQKIGNAIQQMYQEKGLLLVDFYDQETEAGKARLEGPLQNIGNPTDRERTARDILLPLVHFGYLDEIPVDPFPLEDPHPTIDTFIYVDEERVIEGRDMPSSVGERQRLNLYKITYDTNDWFLISPGPNGSIFERPQTMDNPTLQKIDVVSQPPFVEHLKEKAYQDMVKIGHAIEQLRAEKGVLLVDGWDDDTGTGRSRLRDEFDGVGDVPESTRVTSDILQPLVHFGYLDEIPLDPFVRHNPASPTQSDTYWYTDYDGDPELWEPNYAHNWDGGVLRYIYPDPPLEKGEWMLMSAGPVLSPVSIYIRGISITLRSSELDTPVFDWPLY